MSEIGVWRRDGLELDEPTEPLDLIEMDTDIAPEEQPAALDDHTANADSGGKRGGAHGPVVHLDDPLAALALLRFVRTVELDEVRSSRMLFSELQTAVCHLEIGVLLPDLAVVFGAESPAHLKRAVWVWIACLQLDVSPRSLHPVGCDGVLAINSVAGAV